MTCEKFTRSFKKLKRYTHLSNKQLETLVNKPKQGYTVGGKTISKGAYFRIREQAVDNITKSIMTLALASHCDIISHHDVITTITKIMELLDEDVQLEKIYKVIREILRNSKKSY